MDVMHL